MVAVLLLLAFTVPAFAADTDPITITGTGKCAKCSLKETAKCQTAILVEKDGKTKTYYVVQNDKAKAFHSNICTESKKVTATGTVKEVDGKLQLTVTKIALADK